MNLLRKYILEVAVLIYWVIFMVMSVIDSKKVGFYPASMREQAQLNSNLQPYPWSEIFNAWFIITLFSVGLLLIVVKSKRIPINVLVYSFLITLSYAIYIPTDTGGVTYTIINFGCYLFISTAIYLVFAGVKTILRSTKIL